jgi:regulator of sigma E protease
LSNILSILGALLLLTLFVTVHELGHFTAGRLLGFGILEFSIGMGPVLVKTRRKGTQYSIRALPMGGMCRFYGEDDIVEQRADMVAFPDQPVWKRMLVVLAGPVMNVVLAVVLAVVALQAFGDYVPQVESFTMEHSVAQEGGMQVGDILHSINGKQILYFEQTVTQIRAVEGDTMVVVVERQGQRVPITLHGFYNEAAGHNLLGISMGAVRKSFGFLEAWGHSLQYVWATMLEMFAFIGGLFSKGVQPQDVVGPVGVISILGESVRLGWEVVLRVATLITVNLAIMNILPLPALDGGRLAFMLVEAVRGKPVPPEKEGLVHVIGMVLLFGLAILLTVKDVAGLIGR